MIINKRWCKAIIRRDIDYLLRNQYITIETHSRVIDYLSGKLEDDEIAKQVAEWAELDAIYADEMLPATCRFLWFIYPFMWLAIKLMGNNMRGYAKEIRGNQFDQ